MRLLRQGAAILAALFLFSPLGWTKKNPENLENFHDLISKSQVLLLQRDRNQAAQVLIGAMEREGTKSSAFAELSKALQKTAEIFFSEKAQQAYEVAIAEYPTNKPQTSEKLKDVLKMEPMNGLILKGLSFALLANRECQQSKKYTTEVIKINPFDTDLEKLQVLEHICANNRTEATLNLAKMESQGGDPIFISINRQRLQLPEAASLPMSEIGERRYSEVVYFEWFNEKDFKKKMLLAEKYRNLCQAPIAFDKAYSKMDPWVCDHAKEVEEFHAKGERSL